MRSDNVTAVSKMPFWGFAVQCDRCAKWLSLMGELQRALATGMSKSAPRQQLSQALSTTFEGAGICLKQGSFRENQS